NFYGFIDEIILDGNKVDINKLPELVERVSEFQEQIEELQTVDIGAINYQLERNRLKERKHKLDETLTAEVQQALNQKENDLKSEYQVLEREL
ncbi:MAG: phosphate ABC transporter, permease protein PstA, partial [Pseudoalteromonas marina]